MTEMLPLFPLGTVLYPGLVLPLHVFEDRYRELVQELLELPDGSPRRFGVVAIRSGRDVGADGVRALHDVGCAAELRAVTPYDDGRYDIVTTGGARFRLVGFDAARPYLVGDVEWLSEESGGSAEAEVLAGRVSAAFSTYLTTLAGVRGAEIEVPELPADPLVLSYLVAATVVVDLVDKQLLLAEADATSRLRAELTLLRRETSLLRTLTSAPAPELTHIRPSPN